MYFVDSRRDRIYRYAFDPVSGEATGREIFIDTSALPGIPDGLRVDAAGDIWCAFWDGAQIVPIRPGRRPPGAARGARAATDQRRLRRSRSSHDVHHLRIARPDPLAAAELAAVRDRSCTGPRLHRACPRTSSPPTSSPQERLINEIHRQDSSCHRRQLRHRPGHRHAIAQRRRPGARRRHPSRPHLARCRRRSLAHPHPRHRRGQRRRCPCPHRASGLRPRRRARQCRRHPAHRAVSGGATGRLGPSARGQPDRPVLPQPGRRPDHGQQPVRGGGSSTSPPSTPSSPNPTPRRTPRRKAASRR